MGLFGNLFSTKIVVEGASAEEAHSLMHEFDIEHHTFHDFNGLNLTDDGYGGLMALGSNKVEIPLHGKAARNPHGVADVLRGRNSAWKVRVK